MGFQVSLKKSKIPITNSYASFEVLIDDNVEINQVGKFKYLGALWKAEIKRRIQQGQKIVESRNSLWWDRNLLRMTD